MTTRIFGSPRYFAGLVCLAGAFSLVGCNDGYSEFIVYVLRTDPLAMNDKFGDEQIDPDRPGVLPIMVPKDLDNPANPMYPKRTKLFPDQVLRDPTLVKRDDKKEIKDNLDNWFGSSPRDPRVEGAPDLLQLKDDTLAEGSRLYRIHCLHCHGVMGDGRGITAKWVNPHPRDFRQGLFKFTSVDQTSGPAPPRREDLRRTLVQGIEGTAMPAFNLLQPKEIEQLISFVMHLSIRGQTEFETIKNGFAYSYDAEKKESALTWEADESISEYMKIVYEGLQKKWVKSQTKPIEVQPYPFPEGVDNPEFKASVQRGYNYFLGKEEVQKGAKGLNCVSCHVNFGRQSMFKWDSWGTLTKPNNLTNGIYRGGRRPIDIYYRIHSGINGSNMVAFGATEKSEDTKTAVWDLVNFVQVLPYPAMREKLGIKID